MCKIKQATQSGQVQTLVADAGPSAIEVAPVCVYICHAIFAQVTPMPELTCLLRLLLRGIMRKRRGVFCYDTATWHSVSCM